MAIIFDAVLKPTKLDLLTHWLPSQSWFDGDPEELELVGSFRFDDPGGEVGIETHLVRAGDKVFQAPLTYRGAPLEAAGEWLIGTMEHSVLGQRWVYDACGDPVYAAALAATLLAGQPQAKQYLNNDGELKELPSSVQIEPGGAPGDGLPEQIHAEPTTAGDVTTIRTGAEDLAINRVLDLSGKTTGTHFVTGTWQGNPTPVQLAWIPDA
ncbi:CG0192-related protein [Arthrobacter monumenti]